MYPSCACVPHFVPITVCALLSLNVLPCTAKEKELVDDVFQNAIAALSEEDKHLPQVCKHAVLWQWDKLFAYCWCGFGGMSL